MIRLELKFAALDPNSSTPVYLQIVRQFKLFILREQLTDGDEIPSRRVLAAQMGVNPNTMQKAFAEMENEGLIVTPANAKSIVRTTEETKPRLRAELLGSQVSDLVATARSIGVDYKQLTDLISESWDEKNDV